VAPGAAAQVYLTAWKDALENDLGTPQALAALWSLVKDAALSPGEKLGAVLEMDKVLGLGLDALKATTAEVPAQVTALAEARAQARKTKDWKRSDEIRDELKALGWAVEDTASGPVLKKL